MAGGHTKTARGPASEPSDEQRLGVSVVPGSTRSLQLSVSAALRRIGSSAAWSRSWLVETRRLELLTLSLQRRCSTS